MTNPTADDLHLAAIAALKADNANLTQALYQAHSRAVALATQLEEVVLGLRTANTVVDHYKERLDRAYANPVYERDAIDL